MAATTVVMCPACGHHTPRRAARGRGFFTCSCGLRIECTPEPKPRSGMGQTVFAVLTFAGLVTAVMDLVRRLR
jgi:hypothetical protein